MTIAAQRVLSSDMGQCIVFIAEVPPQGELPNADRQSLSKQELERLNGISDRLTERKFARMLAQAIAAATESMEAQVGLIGLSNAISVMARSLGVYGVNKSLGVQAEEIRSQARDLQKQLGVVQAISTGNPLLQQILASGLQKVCVSEIQNLQTLEPKGKEGSRVIRLVTLRSDKTETPALEGTSVSEAKTVSAKILPFNRPATEDNSLKSSQPPVLSQSQQTREAPILSTSTTSGLRQDIASFKDVGMAQENSLKSLQPSVLDQSQQAKEVSVSSISIAAELKQEAVFTKEVGTANLSAGQSPGVAHVDNQQPAAGPVGVTSTFSEVIQAEPQKTLPPAAQAETGVTIFDNSKPAAVSSEALPIVGHVTADKLDILSSNLPLSAPQVASNAEAADVVRSKTSQTASEVSHENPVLTAGGSSSTRVQAPISKVSEISITQPDAVSSSQEQPSQKQVSGVAAQAISVTEAQQTGASAHSAEPAMQAHTQQPKTNAEKTIAKDFSAHNVSDDQRDQFRTQEKTSPREAKSGEMPSSLKNDVSEPKNFIEKIVQFRPAESFLPNTPDTVKEIVKKFKKAATGTCEGCSGGNCASCTRGGLSANQMAAARAAVAAAKNEIG